MATESIAAARNFRQVDNRIATCGQPNEAQLASARDEGVEVVINLALHDDPRYSLKDERATVEGLGMSYIHIPVQFTAPTEADAIAFFDAMDAHRERAVLVHCAANYRVTAFLGLYRCCRQGWPRDTAFELMDTVWQPDPVWSAFIDEMIDRHAG